MEKEERKYICIEDLQGGSFAVGRVHTAKEWKKQALEWCEQDDNEEYYKFLKRLPLKYIIGEIASMWDLAIIPVEQLPLQEIWDLFDYVWWNEINLNSIKNKLENENDKEILENIKSGIKDIRERVLEIWNK